MLALVLGSCGEDPLRGLGEDAASWIDEPEPPTTQTAPPSTPPQPFISAGLVEWWNDDLGRPSQPDPEAVLADVAARAQEEGRFVQASRWEIAAVLPELSFPARLPGEVRAVTSQLVLAPGETRLDDETHAAFGLWTSEPYAQSASAGRVGMLLIGPGVASGLGCDEQPSCTLHRAGDTEVAIRPLGSGVVAEWELDGLEYRLEVESSELAVSLVSSLNQLTELNPVISERASLGGLASPGRADGSHG